MDYLNRVAYRKHFQDIVKLTDAKKLDAMEISGSYGKWWGFKTFTTCDYPAYDICEGPFRYEDGRLMTFDIILAEQVWEHLQRPYAAIRHVHKMLKPGGYFWLAAPFIAKKHEEPADCSRWSSRGLKNLLIEAGFEEENIQSWEWGTQECVRGDLERGWAQYDPEASDLTHQPEWSCMSWALARKPQTKASQPQLPQYNRAYFINLDIRTARRARIEKQLNVCPWSKTRIPGVVLESAPEDLGIVMDRQRQGMRGVAGIWRAHRNCLEEALREQDGRSVIFEDDVSIHAPFWDEILPKLETPPDDWEIILISPRFKNSDGPVDYDFDGFQLLDEVPHGSSGAHFVIFRNHETIRKILKEMDKGPVTDVDVFYIKEFKTYGFMSSYVRAGGFESDHEGLGEDDIATLKKSSPPKPEETPAPPPPQDFSRTNGAIVQFTDQEQTIFLHVPDGRDTIQREHHQGRFYEREELEIIGRHFPKGGVFLDVGANIGNHSIYIGKFLQPSKIIPVEPLPEAVSVLCINLKLNDLLPLCDCRMIGLGFGASAHFASAKIIPGNLGATQLIPTEDQTGLKVVPGDEAVGSDRIDFIKIDTEKMELQALKGLEQTIARNRPTMFIAVDHENRSAFEAWRSGCGYEIVDAYSRYESNENLLIQPKEKAAS